MEAPLDMSISRGATGALDAALLLLRREVAVLLPLYVLAIAPVAVAMLWVIDAVAAQDRSSLAVGCALLTGATLWRWVGLAAVQRHVQTVLRGQAPLPIRRRLLSLVTTRLYALGLLTWGALVLIPAYWGQFLTGFATPALLERSGPAGTQVSRALRWITTGINPLARAGAAVAAVMGAVVLGAIATQLLLARTVIPALTGIDPTALQVTMSGIGWWLSVAFLLFCLYDLYWHVAGVTLFYHLAGRRLGTDLQLRLQALQSDAASTG
jgi:hypothetical protein